MPSCMEIAFIRLKHNCVQDESRPDAQEQTSTEARPEQPEPSAQQAEADAAEAAAASTSSGALAGPQVFSSRFSRSQS